MEKYVATYKTAKEAGAIQREATTTFVDDLNDTQREAMLLGAGCIVRTQSRLRGGQLKFEDVDGKEVLMSSLLTRAEGGVVTKEKAVKVYADADIETKIEMLYDMNLPTEAIRATLDANLAKGMITKEDRELADELLDMA
jgi:hypothetical protein